MALNLGPRFLLGGRIVTPRVFKILKLAMTSYALQSIWTYWKLGYAITKTSLLYVVCVELCCLNQVWNTCIVLKFQKPWFSAFKSYPKNPFQNLSIFWGWSQKQKCRAWQVIQSLFFEFFKLFRKISSNSKRRNSLNFPIQIQKFISKSRPN